MINLMKLSKTLYAYRSKKNGQFFKFEQYSEDGWGKYEATKDFEHDVPELHDRDLFNPQYHHYEFKNHTDHEVETLVFSLTQQ